MLIPAKVVVLYDKNKYEMLQLPVVIENCIAGT